MRDGEGASVDSAAVSKANKRERQRVNREAARAARLAAEKRSRTLRSVRNFAIVAVIAAALIAVVALTSKKSKPKAKAAAGTVTCTDRTPPAAHPKSYAAPPPMSIDRAAAYTAQLETSCGTITVALDAQHAPVATNNFVFLANQGFYDGLTFHRAAKDFVIQGGDPKGDGSGGPGYTVVGEVPTDGYPIGSLAAAKTGSDPPGTFGSQFFVVTGSQGATLPDDYARFGTVTGGLDVAQKIDSFAPASGDGAPTRPVYLFKVSITESPSNTAGSPAPPSTRAP